MLACMVSKEPERKAFHWPNLRQFEPQNKEVEELINKPLKKIEESMTLYL